LISSPIIVICFIITIKFQLFLCTIFSFYSSNSCIHFEVICESEEKYTKEVIKYEKEPEIRKGHKGIETEIRMKKEKNEINSLK
jgi:hypothetical protein